MAGTNLGWVLMKCPTCRAEWSVPYLKATREVPRCPQCASPGYAVGTASNPVKRTPKGATK